ncbi:IS110 family transposase [Paenibacillus sp. 1-18]|uniref:IS110 family transposase n=1 Tax=Paenibacillus sp. 1-18 TaxID=1333846 RepID=UPI001E3A4B8B|nr:IS110 family transposase [Paenibacillus sp. 1-18]
MPPYRVTMPVVVLEATGHYHRNLVGYLKRSGWIHYIVNPLQAKRSKGTQLRKVKTDAADTWHLAEMNYRGDVKAHRSHRSSRLEMSRVPGRAAIKIGQKSISKWRLALCLCIFSGQTVLCTLYS